MKSDHKEEQNHESDDESGLSNQLESMSISSPRSNVTSVNSTPRFESMSIGSPRLDEDSSDFSSISVSAILEKDPREEHFLATASYTYTPRTGLPSATSEPMKIAGARLDKKLHSTSSTVLTGSSGDWKLVNTVKDETEELKVQTGLVRWSGKFVLGKGEFGKVRLAYSKERGYVAVKKILQDKINNGEYEIHKILTDEKVSGILPVYDAVYIKKPDEKFSKLYILMKVANGGSGKDLLDYQHLFEEEEWFLLIEFIADRLIKTFAEMHAKGFYHLDLKPDNFLLHHTDKKLRVYLNDFGSAEQTNLDGKILKEAGKLAGAEYQPWEADFISLFVLQNRYTLEKANERLEAWRFGVTLLKLLDKEFASHYINIAKSTTNEMDPVKKLQIYINAALDDKLKQYLEEKNYPERLKELLSQTLCIDGANRAAFKQLRMKKNKMSVKRRKQAAVLFERVIIQRQKEATPSRASQLKQSVKNTLSKSTHGINARVSGFFHRKSKNDGVIESHKNDDVAGTSQKHHIGGNKN